MLASLLNHGIHIHIIILELFAYFIFTILYIAYIS